MNRAIRLGGALIGEAAQVQVDRAAEEQVADVELRPLHDVRDQDFLKEHEEALDGHAQDDQADKQQQIAKGVRGQVAVDEGFQSLVAGQPGLLAVLVLLDLCQAIANRGKIAGLQPGAAAAQLGEAGLHDIVLLTQDVDLGQLFLDELRPEALQIGKVDGALAFAQLLPDRVRLVVESLVILGELRRLKISQLRGVADLPGFFGLGVQQDDLLADRIDLGRDPALGVLALEKDIEKRQYCRELGEIEERHHRRTGDGKHEASAMGPGESYQPHEIFHEQQCRREVAR